MERFTFLVAFSLLGVFGCREKVQDGTGDVTAADRTDSLSDGRISSSFRPSHAEIFNSFGMTFVRIDIDPNVHVRSDPPFPTETYYIQKTEISAEHLKSFRAFARIRNVDPQVYEGFPMSSPSEWRHYGDLAGLMSEYDPEYDYRLPTKSEWVFACMSGYEQRCTQVLEDESKPNAYGLLDMLDGDVECLSEVGVLMGLWIENWPGIYDGYEKPSCACKWWTICNPDADDSLNEIIVGRFVLVQENG